MRGVNTLCRGGVLAASSGTLQLREGAGRSVSLVRLPHSGMQHEVQSLATAQPATCVLIPSPQHLLAAGVAPALDEPSQDMMLRAQQSRAMSCQE